VFCCFGALAGHGAVLRPRLGLLGPCLRPGLLGFRFGNTRSAPVLPGNVSVQSCQFFQWCQLLLRRSLQREDDLERKAHMRGGFIVMTMLLVGASAAAAAPANSETTRIADAARVIRELRSAPDNGIPEGVWERARCVAVMPGVKKAAFVVGGEFGKGVVSCRTATGWSAPVFLTLEKGSFGAQIGAQSTDVVLLVMNERGIERLLQDKVTLGADASLAAGPVGRTGAAATDVQLTAEMLSYSRARGVFAGIDLSGGVLRPDNTASRHFYGHVIAGRELLLGNTPEPMPTAANPLIAALNGRPRGVVKRGA
jgi:SH3 domain-containing YSC84-like protein 1